jgi:peptidoglycan biosynthesis protein MviN/MurJ (putative lipid II flippase)
MLFFILFFGRTGVGMQGFMLVKLVKWWHSTTSTTTPVHFVLVILEMGGLMNYLLELALNCYSPDLSLPSS